MVDTGGFFDWKRVYDDAATGQFFNQMMEERFGTTPDRSLADEIIKRQHMEDLRFSWRNADGALVYDIDEKLLVCDEKNEDKIASFKLVNNDDADFGCLLGYFAHEDEVRRNTKTAAEDLCIVSEDGTFQLDRARFFKIGRGARVSFQGDGIAVEGKSDSIPFGWRKATLFIVVNDCIMTRENFDSLCGEGSGVIMADYRFQRSFYENKTFVGTPGCDLKGWQKSLAAIWFWNNIGSFTVVIEKRTRPLFGL